MSYLVANCQFYYQHHELWVPASKRNAGISTITRECAKKRILMFSKTAWDSRQLHTQHAESLQRGSLLESTLHALLAPEVWHGEEVVAGLADFDERLQRCVTALSLFYICSLLRTCSKWQNFCRDYFSRCLSCAHSAPKAQVQCSRSASCTP